MVDLPNDSSGMEVTSPLSEGMHNANIETPDKSDGTDISTSQQPVSAYCDILLLIILLLCSSSNNKLIGVASRASSSLNRNSQCSPEKFQNGYKQPGLQAPTSSHMCTCPTTLI